MTYIKPNRWRLLLNFLVAGLFLFCGVAWIFYEALAISTGWFTSYAKATKEEIYLIAAAYIFFFIMGHHELGILWLGPFFKKGILAYDHNHLYIRSFTIKKYHKSNILEIKVKMFERKDKFDAFKVTLKHKNPQSQRTKSIEISRFEFGDKTITSLLKIREAFGGDLKINIDDVLGVLPESVIEEVNGPITYMGQIPKRRLN